MPSSSPTPELMENIVNLCKRRGFIFPSSEIYGGFRSTYDYGPLGVLMLRNVKDGRFTPGAITKRDYGTKTVPPGYAK